MLHRKKTRLGSKLYLRLPLLLVMIMVLSGLSGCNKGNNESSDGKSPAANLLSNKGTPVQEKLVEEELVVLASAEATATVYLDSKGEDYEGLSLVAKSFAEDINLITGITPNIVTDSKGLKGVALIAGSIGNNDIIDKMIAEGKINPTAIKDKWECYQIQVVDKPMEGLDKAIVIIGSDKRGTIYGIYHISELMGVSPWLYWGDVLPAKKEAVKFSKEELTYVSKEPSVKYRGIFLNDEWPSLGSWVNTKFGGFNEKFYDEVFELILRLKGNYLWPAMWSSSFSEDGVSHKQANAQLANIYGIVMGTSHHEPMFRAGVEWQRIYKKYGTSNTWDFAKNQKAITKFWEDGLARNKEFESIITLGMRGEADSALQGSDEQNIKLLKNIITTQKQLLDKYKLSDTPQVLTLYKEVEKFWYGTNSVAGLKDWEVLDDVTIMLAEDNFSNVRTLPTLEERNREAGWGMYYHFDYHGGPRSYEWVNTVPITKVWEQMSMAYDYGVRDIWIVNVGDLKPMELPISYFLDLAYDFDTWGTEGINKTTEYMKNWAKQQFGEVVDKTATDGIAEVLSDYTRFNGNRKPEITYSTTYSFTNYNEAQRVLKEADTIIANAKKYYELMPKEYKDTYYQLVYYPAVASANVTKMQIFAGLSDYYYKQKSVLANTYAALAKEAIKTDKDMEDYYNNKMSVRKWKGMMSSAHIGYTSWNDEGWRYPDTKTIVPGADYSMIVSVEGSEQAYLSGRAVLPIFTNLGKEAYSITISNGGTARFDYSVTVDNDWIKLSKNSGAVLAGDSIQVTIDWDKIKKSSVGIIRIEAEGDLVEVEVNAQIIDTTGLTDMTFVEMHDVVSIEAEHYTKKEAKSGVDWRVIDNYGRTLSSVKMFPTDVSFKTVKDAPYLEYQVFLNEDGEYTLTTYTAPTNNLSLQSRLRYGGSFDGGELVVADALPKDFIAGDNGNQPWNNAVMVNAHITTTTHKLTKGLHTLRFYGVDAGLVLQKLVLSRGALPASYYGPQESYYVSKTVSQQEAAVHTPDLVYSLPGKIPGKDIKVNAGVYSCKAIIPVKGNYKMTLVGSVTENAEIKATIGNTVIGTVKWEKGKKTVESAYTSLNPMSGSMNIEVISGKAEIQEVSFELEDTIKKYPVKIKASSTETGTSPSNVMDNKKATFWKPKASDTKPWIEVVFGEEYYMDHFAVKGDLSGITSYEIQMSNASGKWSTVYKGSALQMGRDIYFQGTKSFKGNSFRIVFTGLKGSLELSELELEPYINWAREDSKTSVTITKESDIDKKTIIDGDRINPGWITTGNQTVTLSFSKPRLIDSVTVVGIQETVKDGGAGIIPDADLTSAFVQRQYTVYYADNNNKWVKAADYITAPDGKETEPLRKVINKITLESPVTTSSIKIEIGTSHWIRLIELETVESRSIALK